MSDIVERLRDDAFQCFTAATPGTRQTVGETFVEAADEIERLRELVLDLTAQACERDGELDSMAISTYADAMRYLADLGWVTIDKQAGRRVIGRWADDDD